jgi:hypothetical protein
MVAWMIGSSPRLGALIPADDQTSVVSQKIEAPTALEPPAKQPGSPQSNSQGKTKQP